MAETTNIEETPSVRCQIQQANGYSTYTYSWSGTFEKMKAKVESFPIGYTFENDGELVSGDKLAGGVVCASQATRREGKLGDAVISVGLYNKPSMQKWFISLDTLAVPKDIRTWEPNDGSEKPDQISLGQWEGLEEVDFENYNNFMAKKSDGEYTALTGSTLELAKMIRQGISSYTIHAPCVTASFYDPNLGFEYFENLDKQYTSSKLVSLLTQYRIGTTDWSNILARTGADHWLLSDIKLTQQANGLSQITLRWIGATNIEEKLYEKVS